jgi:hypothetical protein
MANELKLTWSISVDKEPPMSAPVSMNIFNQQNNVSTGNYIKNTVLASHTGRTIVPLGGVGTNSLYFAFYNPSPTETVNVFTDGSSGPIFAELRPGTSGVIPVPATITPYVEATGSIDVEIEYIMYGR